MAKTMDLGKWLEHPSDKAIAWDLQKLITNSFKCEFCVASQNKETCSVVMESLPKFDLKIVDDIKKTIGSRLVDIRIWGVGYAPKSEASDKWIPMCIEVVFSKYNAEKKHNPSNGVNPYTLLAETRKTETSSSIDGSESTEKAKIQPKIPNMNLSMITDKNIKRIIEKFITCISIGERPDVYQYPINNITYYHEEKDNTHFVMFDSVPTLNLAVLDKLRYLFSLSLSNIIFERRSCATAGKFSDKDSATTMIVVIDDLTHGGYTIAKNTTRSKGYSPY